MPARAGRFSSVPWRYVGILGALWGASASTSAQTEAEQPVRVVVAAPESACLPWSRVRGDIESAVARRVFVDAETGLTSADVELTIRVYDELARAELELRDPNTGAGLGRRVLVASSCTELGDSMSLALSLMLDFNVRDIPELRARAAEEERRAGRGEPDGEAPPGTSSEAPSQPHPTEGTPRPAEPQPRPVEVPPPRPPRQTALPDSARSAFEVRAGGVWTLGNSPGVGLGITGAAGMRLAERWYFAAGVAHYFPSSRSALGGRVTASRTDLIATFCPLRWGSDLELRACTHLGAGWLRAGASGFDQTDAAQSWIATAGLGMLGVYPVQPLLLWVEVAGDVALKRASFTVLVQDTSREAYSMSAVWGSLQGGIGLVFE